MWNELNDYELRNVLYHLVYARQWQSYESVLLQSDFLEEFIIRNGYGLLLDTLGGTVALCGEHQSALTNTKSLLQLLHREAGSLDGWQKNEKNHSFFDQVASSSKLFDLPLPLKKSGSENQKIQFRVRWKEITGGEAVRMLMPGKRRAVGWDIYDAGWMSPHTTILIDVDKDLLKTQTSIAYHFGFSNYEYTYYGRDYSLLKCTLLKEYPLVVVNDAYLGKSKGPSEILLPERSKYNVRHSKKLETKIRKHLVARGMNRKAELLMRVLATSCNTDHLLLEINTKAPGSNNYTHEPFYNLYATAADSLVLSAVSSKSYLVSASAKEMVALNHHLYLFYTDSNDDLIRIEVSPVNDQAAIIEGITSSDADPACKYFLLVRSETVDVRAVPDGSLVRQISFKEGVSSFNIHSMLCKEGSRFAICTDKMITRYSLLTTFSETFKIERSNKDLELSRDLKYYVTGRKVYEFGSPVPVVTFAVDIEVAPHYQSSKGYISYYNNLYIEKSYYLICVWNLQTGRSIGSFCSDKNHMADAGHLMGYDLSPDERFIISANDGSEILVWDLWNLDQEVHHHPARLPNWRLNNLGKMKDIQTVKFFNGGYWILVVTQDQQLYVCSFESDAKVLGSIRLHQIPQSVHAPVFGKTVLAAFSDGSVICYEISGNIPGTRVEENGVFFSVKNAHATSMEIAGSFNNWQPVPMIKVDTEVWQFHLRLEKGRYEFKYLVDGLRWELDPVMCSLPAPFGFNSYVDI